MKKATKENTFSIEKMQTGIPGFDEICYGGLAVGKTTLVSGTAGSGKTILACQFIYKGVEEFNERGVFISFEEKALDLKKNMLQFRWDFEAMEKNKKVYFIDASISADHSTQIVGSYDLEGLLSRIEGAITAIKPRRVVLDSIGSLFYQFQDSTIIRNELFKLVSFLNSKGVTTVITSERLQDYGNVSRFGVEEYIADHVIILRNILEKDKRRRTLEILKYRGSDHKRGEQPFIINADQGIVVMPVSTLELKQKSSGKRVSSGNARLDDMCGGGFFRDSVILVSGATGTGKTLMVA